MNRPAAVCRPGFAVRTLLLPAPYEVVHRRRRSGSGDVEKNDALPGRQKNSAGISVASPAACHFVANAKCAENTAATKLSTLAAPYRNCT